MLKSKGFGKTVPNIIDQNSDQSLAKLRKFASLLKDEDFGDYVWNLGNTRTMVKTAECTKFASQDLNLFPVNSKGEVILSKVYFEGQREKIASYSPVLASEIESKLDTYIDLYSVPDAFQMAKEATAEKTDFRPKYLLPSTGMFKVATVKELNSAADRFTKNLNEFSLSERVEFSKEFSKVAVTIKDQRIPKTIQTYCGVMESDLDNVKAMLNFRKIAANRLGKDGIEYVKLASAISDVTTTDTEGLEKLADTIYAIDKKYGFDFGKMSKSMPDAYSVVFNKEASEEDEKDEDSEFSTVKQYTKADIISQFGEDAVEALENPDGTINYKKLKVLIDSSPIKDEKRGQ